MSTEQAVAWLASHGVTVTANYLTTARRTGQLAAAIVAGKRRYSTQAVWNFIVSRPTTTRRKPIGRKNA